MKKRDKRSPTSSLCRGCISPLAQSELESPKSIAVTRAVDTVSSSTTSC